MSENHYSVVDHLTINVFVESSHKPVLVLFYAPWCGHCKRFKPELDRLSALMGDSIRIGIVNGDHESELSHEYNVKGFPTLFYWPQGQKGEDVNRQEYHGARTAAAIKKHIIADVKSDQVIVASNQDEIKKLVLSAPLKRVAVFFSSRRLPPPLMSIMSYSKQLKELPFVFVSRAVSEQVQSEFGFTKSPTIGVLKLAEDGSFKLVEFQEERVRYGHLATFFKGFITPEAQNTESEQRKTKKKK